ncbi:hypothetical protein CEF21_10885 [Bacillus sp. FJAT-42376]|uniref:DUF6884 domain-containing protein n=1 Tax=Bacillus sp. FJAT-42376 TaxID=2014076 RepID=UPI000F4E6D86|nr:DUF6884 domain-containing protein [Bacillus sp. FJAT-42376]AZB42758.1 hypothetical protein CEF21_10885 [Bacillus sp. FJAT-42376]
MERLCIIPCGKRKIWDQEPDMGAVEARFAYTGIFHRLCQDYARTFFGQWVILSAKHGFLRPEDPVPENYDLGFHMKHPDIITIYDLKQQLEGKQLNDVKEVIMLGGKKFAPILADVFGKPAVFPLRGSQGIGEMQRKLKEAVMTGKEINPDNGAGI